MSIRQVDNTYHVCAQIKPADVTEIKSAGYKLILCMRPDNEGMGQPDFAEIKQEAEKHGLEAHYLPVSPGSMPHEHASSLRKILKSTTGPVLAYCASGNRSTMLYQMSKQSAD